MFSSLSEKQKGLIALVGLAFIFASMGIFARYLQADFTLFQQMYLRVGLAFILGCLLFYPAIHFRKLLTMSKKDWSILFIRTILLNTAVILITLGLFIGKYANVMVAGAFPLLPLLGYFLLKEKITKEKLFYITLGFIGIILIAVHDFSQVFNLSDWGRGELYAFLSALFFDLSFIARKWQGNHLNNKEITTFMFFLGGVLLIIGSIFVLGEPIPSLSLFNFTTIIIIFLAALFIVANLFLTNYGFERVEAVIAGNIIILEVFFALMISIILYSEIPTLREFIGGALIVFSALQMNRIAAKE